MRRSGSIEGDGTAEAAGRTNSVDFTLNLANNQLCEISILGIPN